jgi:hypothetical protein
MSSECVYDWYWKISACATEYEVYDSLANNLHILARQKKLDDLLNLEIIFFIQFYWYLPKNENGNVAIIWKALLYIYGNVFFTTWQKFWKPVVSGRFGRLHLEVININVRNFNFPYMLLSLPNNVWRLIVFAPFLIIIILRSFRGPWTCPRQISGTTGQNFMKHGGVIDICF